MARKRKLYTVYLSRNGMNEEASVEIKAHSAEHAKERALAMDPSDLEWSTGDDFGRGEDYEPPHFISVTDPDDNVTTFDLREEDKTKSERDEAVALLAQLARAYARTLNGDTSKLWDSVRGFLARFPAVSNDAQIAKWRAEATKIAAQHGFLIWQTGGGCEAFGKFTDNDREEGDRLQVCCDLSIDADPNARVWGASRTRWIEQIAGGDTAVECFTHETLTLAEALAAADRLPDPYEHEGICFDEHGNPVEGEEG